MIARNLRACYDESMKTMNIAARKVFENLLVALEVGEHKNALNLAHDLRVAFSNGAAVEAGPIDVKTFVDFIIEKLENL